MASSATRNGFIPSFRNSPLGYTIVFFIVTTFYYVFWGGVMAVVTSVEKRYSFASWQSGLIIGAPEIGRSISLIPVSYFGGKSNVPRISAISTLLCSMTMVLLISPHFLLESAGFVEIENNTMADNSSISDQLCSFGPRANRSAEDLQMATDRESQQQYVSHAAFTIFVVAMCMLGVFASPLTNISITYIDINASSAKAPLYIGIANSAISFGSMIGAFYGAWAVTIYVDLSYPPITTAHPAWVGAWWIVMVAVSIGGFITAPWLLCFPKRMKRKSDKNQNDPKDTENELEALAEDDKTDEVEEDQAQEKGSWFQKTRKSFLGMLHAIWRILTNPVYALLTLTRLPFEHATWGYFFFLPKYMEVVYSTEAWTANIIGGVNILCIGVAMVAAGSIVTGLKLTYRRTIQMMIALSGVSLILLIVLFFVKCPDANYYTGNTQPGLPSDTPSTCSDGCHCDTVEIMPVCDVTSQVTYLSACDAGCTTTNVNTSIDASYTGCNCTTSGHVSPGLCGQCDTMPVFIVIILLWFGSRGMILSPLAPVTISVAAIGRRVRDSNRPIQWQMLGGEQAWLPTVGEYGIVIDQSCDKWEMLGNEQGYCKIYHRSSFRYYMNGLTTGLLCLELILMTVTLFLVIRYNMTWETKSSKKKRESN